jgi:Tol biopolymer transport system component
VWSPDGKQIAYIASQNEVYRKASDGSGNGELIYKHTPGSTVFLTDWSADGQLCFWLADVIYGLPLEGDRKPVALVKEAGARGGRFSPDGRYLAYSANPSGTFAIYVAPLNSSAAKPLQVSKDPALGGIFWRGDGQELYFMGLAGLAPNGVQAVDLTPGAELQAGVPRQLFRPAGVNSPAQLSSIATRDAERFVFLPPPAAPAR